MQTNPMRHAVVTMTPRKPGPLQAAAFKAQELWAAACDAAGSEGRAAAALAAAGAVLAGVIAVAVLAARRRRAGGSS